MTELLYGDLDEAIKALKHDLISEDGPQISTMRNYRFAILPYLPSEEFKLRQRILTLSEQLRADGWAVLPISLQKLLIERIRATGQENVDNLISREKRLLSAIRNARWPTFARRLLLISKGLMASQPMYRG